MEGVLGNVRAENELWAAVALTGRAWAGDGRPWADGAVGSCVCLKIPGGPSFFYSLPPVTTRPNLLLSSHSYRFSRDRLHPSLVLGPTVYAFNS